MPRTDPASKKSLFDDSASSSSEDDQDEGGVTLAPASATLKINEEYARRFEHNKKREELHRLQEKFKSNGADEEESESSSGESEDDDGHLVTEDLEAEIAATLQAIKNKDPRIYDKNAVFYKPFDPTTEAPKEPKEKPLFLKDYHRERYLKGDVGADDDADEPKPKTYAQEQADLKKSIVSEFHAAVDDEEWSDDDTFLKPAKKPEEKPVENGIHPSRAAAIELTELDVVNADKNPEEYLSKFMASKAWAPAEGSKWQAFESDEGEEDPDLADEMEYAYNMRFEDPNKSNEILKTYSRNMTASTSVRKEELTGRKRQRQLEKEKKEAEKKQREEERARLRRLKIEEASEKLQKIKQAAGLSGKDISEEDWVKFLAEDWSDDKWEEEMKKRFGDDYYAEKDGGISMEIEEDSENEGESSKKKKLKKPKWDDDIDINDIVPDFEDDEKPKISLSDLEDEEEEAPAEAENSDSDSDSDRPAKKRKTSKDVKKEKIAAKREARQEIAKIEALVDSKMDIDNPRFLASSSSKKNKTIGGFRYRETSPTTFGLTARDILLAPSDAALNEFAGLKKLAPFRDAEKKRRDKKKLGKKARLRQWRREQFGREYEHTGPTFGFEKLLGSDEKTPANGANAVRQHERTVAKDNKKPEAVDGIVEGERKKKRKRSKGKGKMADGEGVEA
ncbi:KRI1-like family-domain-containing protein [Echria macrotheca]|uniref:KRI1-like family-domain-containing protein n=1 Tax=Echria macrotheca TaxID=438768 RepID=A0AAJ0B7F0_9PEZI|nr:KRI1-like family-domain-containing protein [Echria macrotheca]